MFTGTSRAGRLSAKWRRQAGADMDGTLDIASPKPAGSDGSQPQPAELAEPARGRFRWLRPNRPDRPDNSVFLLAASGTIGSALTVAVAARLALRPGVAAPSRWFGLVDPVPLDRPSLLPLVMIVGVAVLVGSWWWLCQRGLDGKITSRHVAVVVGCWAVPVLFGPPVLSLDVYSYIAQGTMLAADLDPYATGPIVLGDHPALSPVDPIWRRSPSPYGPVALGYFRLVVELADGDVLSAVFLHRAVAATSVVVVAVCVARTVSPTQRPWALAAAVGSPVVLLQLVGAMHLEALLLALVALGLVAVGRGRTVLGLVLVTAAALVKWPAALVVVAVVVWRCVTAADAGEPGRRAVPTATPPTGAGLTSRLAAVRQARDPLSGLRLSRVGRGAAVAGRDVAVVASAVVVLSMLVPDGFGWLHAVRTPSAGLTLYAPTTGLAALLSAAAGMRQADVRFDDLLALTRSAGVVTATGVFGWLLTTVRQRSVQTVAGLALLTLAVLGPVLYPWYLTWGTVLLAMSRDAPRRLVVAVTAVGSFLALPHCELLFVDHPQVAPWLARQGPVILVVALLGAVAVAVSARRRLPDPR